MSEHELWNELGNLYFLSGAYEQAVHSYRRSIQLNGEFGRSYSNLALTYVQQGNYEEAVRLYRKGIDLLDDNKEKAISWNRLGNVFRQLKDYQAAVLAYQHADELDSEINVNRDEPGNGFYTPSDPAILQDWTREEGSDPSPDNWQEAANLETLDEAIDVTDLDPELNSWNNVDVNQSEQPAAYPTEHDSLAISEDVQEDSNSESVVLTQADSELCASEPEQDDLQDRYILDSKTEPSLPDILDETLEDAQLAVFSS